MIGGVVVGHIHDLGGDRAVAGERSVGEMEGVGGAGDSGAATDEFP